MLIKKHSGNTVIPIWNQRAYTHYAGTRITIYTVKDMGEGYGIIRL